MASNKLFWTAVGSHYNIYAPGESIVSTLPGNHYAAWSGTSMATPVVSGVAALMRSYFWQRDIYSNRFIMGAIVAPGGVVDAYAAITTPPTPGVSVSDQWIFDSKDISPSNNGDGVIDAGETIHLGIELFNRSGLATNIECLLRARVQGAIQDDPYVSISVPGFFVDNIGPWNSADNGFIYDEEGVITGFEEPLVFHVSEDCPNDHVINFEVTTLFNDGWNPDNPAFYTRISNFQCVVTRGTLVPAVISEDTELTSDRLWVVGGPVLIEEGVTLSAMPGTQIQWGAMSGDPYNPGPQSGYMIVRGTLLFEGSYESPISLFPSYLVSGQQVVIDVGSSGRANLKYTKVRNPRLTGGFNRIDHCYLDFDFGTPVVQAEEIGYTIFHKHLASGNYYADLWESCLFGVCWSPPNMTGKVFNNVFLQDNANNKSWQIIPRATTNKSHLENGSCQKVYYDESSNTTYALLQLDIYNANAPSSHTVETLYTAEAVANFFGGHLASVSSPEQQAFMETHMTLGSYESPLSILGMSYEGFPRQWIWLDGTPVTYTNWLTGYPKPYMGSHQLCEFNFCYYSSDIPVKNYWRNSIEGNRNYFWAIPELFILSMPGMHTQSEITTVLSQKSLLDYVRANHRGCVRYNAFLNKFWDPNINNWIRIIAPSGPTTFVSLQDNYYGTESQTLVDHMIIDYNDNFVTAKVDYGTLPAQGFTSTYPFVESVSINGIPAHQVPDVGAGPTTFIVKFNRDMSTDPNDLPLVTFGPTAPYTDFVVKPVGNGWTDPRTWEGTFWIVPVTGDGYHCMRISGAVAADDPWLVSGEDVGRIRFEIQTMGVQAMTLHASGGENSIHLSWAQDDFDLLAGYNLYRSDSIDGMYQKINQTIIPVGSESFIDNDVTPAVPLYYKFTVLQTDFAESDFSNVASASPIDTIPPTITHTPVYQAIGGGNLRFTALAQDNVSVKVVQLFYRNEGDSAYNQIGMINTSGNSWTVTLSGSVVTPPGLQYYITASDGISTAYSGTPAMPYTVTVSNAPTLNSVSPNTGPANGGTLVTLSGNLFQNGATVWFGQEQATDVQVVSQSQIRCITPAHFPAMVDVMVANPDLTECIATNSFTYQVDAGVLLALPNMIGDYGTMVDVPLVISDVEGLVASTVTIHYNPSILRVNQVSKGSLIYDWSLSPNTNNPGEIILSMAGSAPINGTGNLAVLQFEVIANPPASSDLVLYSSVINDGAIEHTIVNGLFTVNGLFSISGQVNYYSDSAAVPYVTMMLSGSGDPLSTVSDETGHFSLSEVPVGSYRLTPSKIHDSNEITSYDASLVLQADAGLITLSSNQRIAADVNKNGIISAMDAFYILQKAVDLIGLPFPGNTAVWNFVPVELEYPLFNSDQTNQLFTGILVGDVSGNWSDSMPQQSMMPLGGEMDPQAVISLIDKTFLPHETMEIPVNLEFASGVEIYSIDIEIQCNGDIIDVQSIASREMIALNNMNFEAHSPVPGIIKIAIAGATPMAIDGTVAVITFTSESLTCSPEVLNLVSACIDEGAVPVIKGNGSIALSPYRSDFSRSCSVGMEDIVLFAEQWLHYPADPLFDIAPIPDLDGKIDLADFSVLSQEWLLGIN